MTAGRRLVPVLLVVSAAMFAAAPFIIDTAPYESTMGLVQRIFYFHVPNAILMMLASSACGVASLVYLMRRRQSADFVALALAELVVVLGVIVLITGPIWARKAWGVWWDWEPRLTSTLIMWMVFSAYLLLRRFGGAGSEVMAAAVGLFGAVLSPFVYWSVNMWRTLHPKTSVLPNMVAAIATGDVESGSTMAGPLIWCFVAFTLFYIAVILLRVRLESTRATLERAVLLLED
ncbi:MAG: cytochrome c biogenesis protein CcsA [Vicinamibacterales bacterium]